MKRIIGQILTLGAYDSWQKLPARDKIIMPLMYFGLLAAYWLIGGLLK